MRRFARRRLLKWLAAAGLARSGWVLADDPDPAARSLPPQRDDWLVFAFGDRAGEQIVPDDLGLAMRQVFAFAMDPLSGQIRDGTRLHQVIVIRLDPAMLSEQTLARSADGVVAYAGTCSHTGCDVTDLSADGAHFHCPCHESEFDPADGARIVGGPAPWPLAALPLKLSDGKLAVAGTFEGRLGFLQPGQDLFGL